MAWPSCYPEFFGNPKTKKRAKTADGERGGDAADLSGTFGQKKPRFGQKNPPFGQSGEQMETCAITFVSKKKAVLKTTWAMKKTAARENTCFQKAVFSRSTDRRLAANFALKTIKKSDEKGSLRAANRQPCEVDKNLFRSTENMVEVGLFRLRVKAKMRVCPSF